MSSPAPTTGPIETLVRALVTQVFEPNDLTASALTPVLKARSAAFLLLVHAEIEEAVEQECHRTANLLKSASEPMTAMMAWGFTSVAPDGTYQKPKKKTPIEELIGVYHKMIEKNHGIREHNLTHLLVPLGIDLGALKTDMLALDEFGGRRGSLAHHPLSMWTTTDLPSVHVSSGIQAALSADRVTTAIQTSHSQIFSTPQRSKRRFRRGFASLLRRLAKALD